MDEVENLDSLSDGSNSASELGEAESEAHAQPAHADSPQEAVRDDAAVKGEVKWFNSSKGFGFVRVGGSDRDAFLHVSSLTPHGLTILHPGAQVTCILADGPRGLQVQSLVSVESIGDPQDASTRFSGERRPPTGPLREMDGTVKFFNARKGFGFVSPDDGGADVFLPARVLTRCGIMDVQPDQRLRMQVRSGLRGMAAESVKEI